MENVINTLHLSGKVVGTPVIGHEAFGEKFYYLTLGVPRFPAHRICCRSRFPSGCWMARCLPMGIRLLHRRSGSFL